MKRVFYEMEKDFGQFNACIENAAVYEDFLEEDQSFIWGCSLQDDKMNYKLLSEQDWTALHPLVAMYVKEQEKSPFKNILVIFYFQHGEACCKIVNGMASILFEKIDRWLDIISKNQV